MAEEELSLPHDSPTRVRTREMVINAAIGGYQRSFDELKETAKRGFPPITGGATTQELRHAYRGISRDLQREVRGQVGRFRAAYDAYQEGQEQADQGQMRAVIDHLLDLGEAHPRDRDGIWLVADMLTEEFEGESSPGEPSPLFREEREAASAQERPEAAHERDRGQQARRRRDEGEDTFREAEQRIEELEERLRRMEEELRRDRDQTLANDLLGDIRDQIGEWARVQQDQLDLEQEQARKRAEEARLSEEWQRFNNMMTRSIQYGFEGDEDHPGIRDMVREVLVNYELAGARVSGVPFQTMSAQEIPLAVNAERRKHQELLSRAEERGDVDEAVRLRRVLEEIDRFIPEIRGRIALLNFRYAWEGKGGGPGVAANIAEALKNHSLYPIRDLLSLLKIPEVHQAFHNQSYVDPYRADIDQYRRIGRWLRRILGPAEYYDLSRAVSVLDKGWGPAVAMMKIMVGHPIKEDNALRKWFALLWSIGPKKQAPYVLTEQLFLEYDRGLFEDIQRMQVQLKGMPAGEDRDIVEQRLQRMADRFHETVRDWSRTFAIPSVLHAPTLCEFYLDNFHRLDEDVKIELLRQKTRVNNGREGIISRRLKDDIDYHQGKIAEYRRQVEVFEGRQVEVRAAGRELSDLEREELYQLRSETVALEARLESLQTELQEVRRLASIISNYTRQGGLEGLPGVRYTEDGVFIEDKTLAKKTIDLLFFNLPRWAVARNPYTGAEWTQMPAVDISEIDFTRLNDRLFSRDAAVIFFDNNHDMQSTKMAFREITTSLQAPTLESVLKFLEGEKRILDELPRDLYPEYMARLVDFPSYQRLLAMKRVRGGGGLPLIEEVNKLEDEGAFVGEFHQQEWKLAEFPPGVSWVNFIYQAERFSRSQTLRLVVLNTAHLRYLEEVGELVPDPEGMRDLWEKAVLDDIGVTWWQFVAWLGWGVAEDGGIQNTEHQREWVEARARQAELENSLRRFLGEVVPDLNPAAAADLSRHFGQFFCTLRGYISPEENRRVMANPGSYAVNVLPQLLEAHGLTLEDEVYRVIVANLPQAEELVTAVRNMLTSTLGLGDLAGDVLFRLNTTFNWPQFDIRNRRDMRKIVDFLISAAEAKLAKPKPFESIWPLETRLNLGFVGQFLEGGRPYGEMFDSGALQITKKKRKMRLAKAVGGPEVRWQPIHDGFDDRGVKIWHGRSTLDNFIEGTFFSRPKCASGDLPLVTHDTATEVMYDFLARRSLTYNILGTERMGFRWEKDEIWREVISPTSLGRVRIKDKWRDGYLREFRQAFELDAAVEQSWENWCGADERKQAKDLQVKKGRYQVIDIEAEGIPEDPFAVGYKGVARAITAVKAPLVSLVWPVGVFRGFHEFKYQAAWGLTSYALTSRIAEAVAAGSLDPTLQVLTSIASIALPYGVGIAFKDHTDHPGNIVTRAIANLSLPRERRLRRSRGVMTGESRWRWLVMPTWDEWYDDPRLLQAAGEYWQKFRESPYIRCNAKSFVDAPYELVNPVRYVWRREQEGLSRYADLFPSWLHEPEYWTRRDFLTTMGTGLVLTASVPAAAKVIYHIVSGQASSESVERQLPENYTASLISLLDGPEVFDGMIADIKEIELKYQEQKADAETKLVVAKREGMEDKIPGLEAQVSLLSGGVDNVDNWTNPEAVDQYLQRPLIRHAQPLDNIWQLARTDNGSRTLERYIKNWRVGDETKDLLRHKLNSFREAAKQFSPETDGELTPEQFEELLQTRGYSEKQLEMARIIRDTLALGDSEQVRAKHGKSLREALREY